MNTDRSIKTARIGGVFSTYIRENFFFKFDSFWFEGSKEFIIDGDRKTLTKILFGIKNF